MRQPMRWKGGRAGCIVRVDETLSKRGLLAGRQSWEFQGSGSGTDEWGGSFTEAPRTPGQPIAPEAVPDGERVESRFSKQRTQFAQPTVRTQWELRSPLARTDQWVRRRSRAQSARRNPLRTRWLSCVPALQAAFRTRSGSSRSASK